MRGLEAAQQLVERVQHLLGELLADLVLELAAVLEQRGEPLRARQRQQAPLAEQQPQRASQIGRPAVCAMSRDAEVEPARALAARRRDQPQRAAVEEQAGRDAGLAQQALHPAVGRRLELPPDSRRASKSAPVRHDAHEQLPRGLRRRCGSRSRTAKSGRSVSPYSGSATSSSGGIGRSVGAGVALRREAPAEDGSGERARSRRCRAGSSSGRRRVLDAARSSAAPRRRGGRGSRRRARAPAPRRRGPVGWTKPSHSRCARTFGSSLRHAQFVSGQR